MDVVVVGGDERAKVRLLGAREKSTGRSDFLLAKGRNASKKQRLIVLANR